MLNFDSFKTELGDWQEPLADFLSKPSFKQTYDFVKREYESNVIFPPKAQIFNAFKQVPFDKLKVVIVG